MISRLLWPLLFAFAAASSAWASEPAAREPLIALHAKRLLDVRHGRYVDDARVIVRGERIVAAGPAARTPVPPGAEVLELPDLTLLPGLIDAHVHLAWGPPSAQTPLPGAEEAAAMLRAGFTSARNPGSTDHADLRLRDAIAAGRVPGPRLQAAGFGLGRPGGICVRTFGEEGAAADAAQARARTQAVIALGADLVKLCAGGGVVATAEEAGDVEFDADALRAIVATAHAAGRKVAAHAQGPQAIAAAANAGVDSIEHGAWIDAAAIRAMRHHRVVLVPTLYRIDWRLEDLIAHGGDAAKIAALRATRAATFAHVRAAVAAGVPIVFGTDASVFPVGLAAHEFGALVEVGLTPAQAIRAATLDAAALMGWQDRVGEIAPGRYADLVGVAGDPLADVRRLEHVDFVMQGGRRIPLAP